MSFKKLHKNVAAFLLLAPGYLYSCELKSIDHSVQIVRNTSSDIESVDSPLNDDQLAHPIYGIVELIDNIFAINPAQNESTVAFRRSALLEIIPTYLEVINALDHSRLEPINAHLKPDLESIVYAINNYNLEEIMPVIQEQADQLPSKLIWQLVNGTPVSLTPKKPDEMDLEALKIQDKRALYQYCKQKAKACGRDFYQLRSNQKKSHKNPIEHLNKVKQKNYFTLIALVYDHFNRMYIVEKSINAQLWTLINEGVIEDIGQNDHNDIISTIGTMVISKFFYNNADSSTLFEHEFSHIQNKTQSLLPIIKELSNLFEDYVNNMLGAEILKALQIHRKAFQYQPKYYQGFSISSTDD